MLSTLTAVCLLALQIQTAPGGTPRASETGQSEPVSGLSPADISQLQAQAESGSATAQLRLGRAFERGDGVPQDDRTAAGWYARAADQGNAEAQARLGLMLFTGRGVERDKHRAVLWFYESARQGNVDAMYNLGVAYYNGDGIAVDDATSYAWFLLARDAGSTLAVDAVRRAEAEAPPSVITDGYKQLAKMYDGGIQLPANQTEAMRWWLRAANRGDADAQIALAGKLIDGKGVAQDFTQALHWCREAANAGDARGQYCIGLIYQRGLGVAPNPKEARRLFEVAADAGVAMAARRLAEMESRGEGGTMDRPSACVLYVELMKAGDKDALKALAKLMSEMDPKEWETVRVRLIGMRIMPEPIEEEIKAAGTK